MRLIAKLANLQELESSNGNLMGFKCGTFLQELSFEHLQKSQNGMQREMNVEEPLIEEPIRSSIHRHHCTRKAETDL